MSNLYLPLHVWDREIDSRLVIGYLASCAGIDTVIGHEYNMSPMYKRDNNAILFRAGGPLDHHIRGNWHSDVTERGGMVMTQDEEGVNNMPLLIGERSGSQVINLDISRIKENMYKTSIKAIKDVKHQIAWSKLHRANMCHKLENIESRSIAANNIEVCSPARFDTLGQFGAVFQNRISESIKNIYGSYILILDNFSVDARGQKGIVDPTKDMIEAGHTKEEIKNYLDQWSKKRIIEKKARDDFAELVKRISVEIPEINIIFRPHPVQDPRYWQKEFSLHKNISIVDKGPIHAWIYGAVATLHSGCTTGLEAYGAKKKTYDVSGIISPRIPSVENSLISQTQQKVTDQEELIKEIKERWIWSQKQENMCAKDAKRGGDKIYNTEGEVYSALDLLKNNCESVAMNIWKEIGVKNASDTIGSRSAISYILERTLKASKNNFVSVETMLDEGCLMKIGPNRGKSRYVTEIEIAKRIKDIWCTFYEFGVCLPKPTVQKIGINVFRLKVGHTRSCEKYESNHTN